MNECRAKVARGKLGKVSCTSSALFPEGGGGPYISAVVLLNVLFRNGFAARTQVSVGRGFRGPGLLELAAALACLSLVPRTKLLYDVLDPKFPVLSGWESSRP